MNDALERARTFATSVHAFTRQPIGTRFHARSPWNMSTAWNSVSGSKPATCAATRRATPSRPRSICLTAAASATSAPKK
ncbi:hypothetical protein Csp2054_05540 [Curtobacterium sp. 'Ferrero']|nr:hypothetical protein Csp2054_05540 [Curtobacterium sp. 'Ferrero']